MSLYGAIDKNVCAHRAATTSEIAANAISINVGFPKAECIFISALAYAGAGGYEPPIAISWSTNVITVAWTSLDAGDYVSYMVVGRNT